MITLKKLQLLKEVIIELVDYEIIPISKNILS